LFASVLGFVTKNIEELCEERNRSSHFLPFFRDQKPETTVNKGLLDFIQTGLQSRAAVLRGAAAAVFGLAPGAEADPDDAAQIDDQENEGEQKEKVDQEPRDEL
jgi:hypothetical protein